MSVITHTLGCQCADFPCTYLGVPLSPWRLPKSAMQPVVDKVAKRLPPWMGRMLNRSGRLILVRSTLCAIRCTFLWPRRSCPRPLPLLRSWFGGFSGTDLRWSGGMCGGLGECSLPNIIWRPWHPQSAANGLRVMPTLAMAKQGGF
jgi:hypothetical protein